MSAAAPLDAIGQVTRTSLQRLGSVCSEFSSFESTLFVLTEFLAVSGNDLCK